jgi:hypothetical protein
MIMENLGNPEDANYDLSLYKIEGMQRPPVQSTRAKW